MAFLLFLTFLLQLLPPSAAATDRFAEPEPESMKAPNLEAVHLAWLERDQTARRDIVYPTLLSQSSFYSNLKPNASNQNDGPFLYTVRAHGELYLLRLAPSRHILSPAAQIGTMEEESVVENHSQLTACHLRGPVFIQSNNSRGSSRGDRRGRAALSVCDGNMTGLIHVGDIHLWIEPAAVGLRSRRSLSSTYPHIVYRKSVGSESSAGADEFCRVNPKDSPRSGERHHHHSGRRERAASEAAASSQRKYYVKTRIVVDMYFMNRFKHFGYEDKSKMQEYILLLVNLVDILYENRATGYDIIFSVTKLDFWHEFPRGFTFSNISTVLLRTFCSFQLRDRRRSVYDTAIYLTGKTLCYDGNKDSCGELGRAYLEAICEGRYSCQVISDTGMRSGFVMAHEFGHLFGVRHDGDRNNCKSSDGRLMSPVISGKSSLYEWSSCSKKYLKNFAKKNLGKGMACLLDKPFQASLSATTTPEALDGALPGATYDLDEQCSFQMNRKDARACPFFWAQSQMCQNLWCYSDRICTTTYIPAVDGTSCGLNRVCARGRCVPMGWSSWSLWSSCSRSCNGGIRSRTRRCGVSSSVQKAIYCRGEPKVIEVCNSTACCQETDTQEKACSSRKDAKGNALLPYRNEAFPCEIWCYNRFQRKPMCVSKAPDGLICSKTGENRCISGRCESFGCDSYGSSSLSFDACGICGGKNKTCGVVVNKFKKLLKLRECTEVFSFEKGVWKIAIEVKSSQTSLELELEKEIELFSSSLYLEHPYVYVKRELAGSVMQYTKQVDGDQIIEIDNKLESKVIFKACNNLDKSNTVEVEYHFVHAKKSSSHSNLVPMPRKQVHVWRRRLGPCSQTCKGGVRRVFYSCYSVQRNALVSPKLCDPDWKGSCSETVPCNSDVICISYRWVALYWTSCSATCGDAVVQKRHVRCRQTGSKRNYDKTYCDSTRELARTRSCFLPLCPSQWSAWAEASTCSAESCGRGVGRESRVCTKREPRAAACEGSALRDLLCGEQPCSVDEYTEQCRKVFGNEAKFVYDGKDIQDCRFSCRSNSSVQQINARDGTRCDFDNEKFCLNSQCKSVDCDGVFRDSSSSSSLSCNNCGADFQSPCLQQTKKYAIKNRIPANYTVYRIPPGSKQLRIVGKSKAGLGNAFMINLKSREGTVGFSTAWFPRLSEGVATGFDVELTYRRPHGREISMSTRGRTDQDIFIELVVKREVEVDSIPTIEVEYFGETTDSDSYDWLWVQSGCGPVCNRGYVYKPECAEKFSGTQVDDFFCSFLPRPSDRRFGTTCDSTPCWKILRDFEPCNESCVDGKPGKQTRVVRCFHNGEKISGRTCVLDDHPSTTRMCSEEDCVAKPTPTPTTMMMTPTPECVDSEAYCSGLDEKNYCFNFPFKVRCCKTCADYFATPTPECVDSEAYCSDLDEKEYCFNFPFNVRCCKTCADYFATL